MTVGNWGTHAFRVLFESSRQGLVRPIFSEPRLKAIRVFGETPNTTHGGLTFLTKAPSLLRSAGALQLSFRAFVEADGGALRILNNGDAPDFADGHHRDARLGPEFRGLGY